MTATDPPQAIAISEATHSVIRQMALGVLGQRHSQLGIAEGRAIIGGPYVALPRGATIVMSSRAAEDSPAGQRERATIRQKTGWLVDREHGRARLEMLAEYAQEAALGSWDRTRGYAAVSDPHCDYIDADAEVYEVLGQALSDVTATRLDVVAVCGRRNQGIA